MIDSAEITLRSRSQNGDVTENPKQCLSNVFWAISYEVCQGLF